MLIRRTSQVDADAALAAESTQEQWSTAVAAEITSTERGFSRRDSTRSHESGLAAEILIPVAEATLQEAAYLSQRLKPRAFRFQRHKEIQMSSKDAGRTRCLPKTPGEPDIFQRHHESQMSPKDTWKAIRRYTLTCSRCNGDAERVQLAACRGSFLRIGKALDQRP